MPQGNERAVLQVSLSLKLTFDPSSPPPLVEERDAPKPAQYWRVASPAYKRAEKPASDWWRVAYPAYKRDASEPSKDWQPSFPPFKRDAPEAAQDWRVASPAY